MLPRHSMTTSSNHARSRTSACMRMDDSRKVSTAARTERVQWEHREAGREWLVRTVESVGPPSASSMRSSRYACMAGSGVALK